MCPAQFPRHYRLIHLLSLTALACWLLSLSACMSPAVTPETPVIPFNDSVQLGVTSRWLHQVPLAGMSGEKPQSVWRLGDSVYVITNQNVLQSIDAAAGTTNWTTDLGTHHFAFFPPQEIHDGSGLVLVNRAQVLLLDRHTGKIQKTLDLPFIANTAPLAVGNRLCIGSNKNFFYCYYVDLLVKAWAQLSQDDYFDSDPVLVSGDSIVIASHKGFLWRLGLDDGAAKWQDRRVNGEVVAGLATDNTLVYIPALNYKVYAFDALAGTHVWDTQLEGRLDQTPYVAGKTLLVPSTGKGLYALSAADGKIQWIAPNITQVIARTADHLYASDAKNTFFILNVATGAVEKSYQIPNARIYVKNTVDATIYVITKDGRLGAFDQASD